MSAVVDEENPMILSSSITDSLIEFQNLTTLSLENVVLHGILYRAPAHLLGSENLVFFHQAAAQFEEDRTNSLKNKRQRKKAGAVSYRSLPQRSC